jgi:hydroxyacyl-ACP dehydratase HTD2-like protein with hotdog domain
MNVFKEIATKEKMMLFVRSITDNAKEIQLYENLNHVLLGMHLFYACQVYPTPLLAKDGYHSLTPALRDSEQLVRRLMFKSTWTQYGNLNFGTNITCECKYSSETKDDKFFDTWTFNYNNKLTETRTLAYVTGLYEEKHTRVSRYFESLFEQTFEIPDNLVTLYSILSMNTHRIHLDSAYARAEGYPNKLVHGTLTASLMLHCAMSHWRTEIDHFAFTAVRPLFVNSKVKIRGDSRQVYAYDSNGLLVMKALYKKVK